MTKKTDLRGADAEVLQILALQSGDPQRVRRVVNGAALTPAVIPHLIPLLGVEKTATDAMHALRAVAPHRPGVLIDALLDVRHPVVMRRRLARVMSVCGTAAVADALLQACEDDHVSVRVQAAVCDPASSTGAIDRPEPRDSADPTRSLGRHPARRVGVHASGGDPFAWADPRGLPQPAAWKRACARDSIGVPGERFAGRDPEASG